ncbi:MAG: PepSY domain-containing protein [Planctomycetota bacterium]
MRLTRAALPLIAIAGAAAPLLQERDDDPRESARTARLSLREAISRARVVQPGRVVEIELEDDPDEPTEMRALLDAVEVELRDLVGAALAVVNGRATSAELELEDDGPVCEIELASGAYLIEVEVDARSGALLDLELDEPNEEDDAEGEEDD